MENTSKIAFLSVISNSLVVMLKIVVGIITGSVAILSEANESPRKHHNNSQYGQMNRRRVHQFLNAFIYHPNPCRKNQNRLDGPRQILDFSMTVRIRTVMEKSRICRGPSRRF